MLLINVNLESNKMSNITTDSALDLGDWQTNGLERQCSDAVDVGWKVTTTCNNGYMTSAPIVHTCQLNNEWCGGPP